MIKITFIDFLDVLIVAFAVYQLLKFIRGTKAMQMFIGLLLILIITFVANLIQFSALSWMLNSLKTVWIIAFVILFQPEIRNALTALGKSRLVKFFYREDKKTFIDEIIKSVQKLQDRGLGSIIVLEGKVGLKHIADNGIKMDAEINSELIVSIFSPKTPLHDGALIIKDEKMIAASCILPLSENPLPDVSMGTRHRAALGLSEETDAMIIVISEEKRTISVAYKAQLKRGFDVISLQNEMDKFYN